MKVYLVYELHFGCALKLRYMSANRVQAEQRLLNAMHSLPQSHRWWKIVEYETGTLLQPGEGYVVVSYIDFENGNRISVGGIYREVPEGFEEDEDVWIDDIVLSS